MSTQVDHEARLKKIQAKMDEQDIDVLIATRLSTVGYVFGAFVPWRGIAVIPCQGEPQLFVLGLVLDDEYLIEEVGGIVEGGLGEGIPQDLVLTGQQEGLYPDR